MSRRQNRHKRKKKVQVQSSEYSFNLGYSLRVGIPRKRKANNFIKKFPKIMLVISTFVIIFGSYTFSSTIDYLQSRFVNIAKPEKVFADVQLASEIYDRNGTRLYRLYGDTSNSDHLKPEEITNIIRASFMAAEDDTFYKHEGFEPNAIIRCAIKTAEGDSKCGGSTITQQLVKIKTQNAKTTIERKVDEVLLAMEIEQLYTKDQILEMYLKVTPYGSNMVGIKTAARFYFGVEDLNNLSLAQAISLAAIVNDPTELSPAFSTDIEATKIKLKEREDYVYDQLIKKMDLINEQLISIGASEDQLINMEMINQARSTEVAFNNPNVDIKAGHFVNYTLAELQKRNYNNGEQPFTVQDLQTGGYKIYTSLDYGLQQVAERYVAAAGSEYEYWNVYNAAVMTTKPSTGEIITMAGSKSFTGQSEGCDGNGENCKYNPEVNVLTTYQSPGSTNKPLAYLIAYEQSKLSPGSFLPDVPIAFGDYVPKNWDGRYLGINFASARQMLRQSRNIPAEIVVTAIGVAKYLETARKFGYTTYGDDSNYGPSVVLGGADVYLAEHAQAYGVFANGGDLVDLNPILKIEDRNGNIVYQANPERKNVADPAAVYLLNQSLFNLETGTGGTIAWDGREIAGKTGTTEENKDALLIMYSPDFVTLGWVGNNNNEPLNQLYGWPGFVVAPWLRGYMSEIGDHGYFANKTPFAKPSNVYYGGGDCDAYGRCQGVARDWLIAGREPARGDIGWGTLGASTSTTSSKYVRYYKMPAPELQRYLDAYLYKGAIAY